MNEIKVRKIENNLYFTEWKIKNKTEFLFLNKRENLNSIQDKKIREQVILEINQKYPEFLI